MSVFDKFKPKTKKVMIASLGQEVEIRELTVDEANGFYLSILDDNKNFDSTKVFNANLKKISDSLVEPKVTVEELKALSGDADKLFAELLEAIDGDRKKKEKGN